MDKEVEIIWGDEGEPKKITPRYMRHWIKGVFLCDEICPRCGDTAIEIVLI